MKIGHVVTESPLRVRLRADDSTATQTPWRAVGSGFVAGEPVGYEVVDRHLIVYRLAVV